jgi:hypothetical protein
LKEKKEKSVTQPKRSVLGSLLCVFGQHIPLDLSLTCKKQQAKLAGNAAKHTKLVKKFLFLHKKF